MNHILFSLYLVFLIIIIWYALGSLLIVKKQGLDPTLVTMINPFYLDKFKSIRIINLLVFLIVLLIPSWINFAAIVLLLFSLGQIVLLTIFERLGTQPINLYALIFVEGLFLLLHQHVYLRIFISILIIFIIIEEIVRVKWQKKRGNIYNKWVARKVLKLNLKYSKVNPSLSNNEWLYTLHFAVTESIARPAIVRLIERIYFNLRKPESITSGIMQVKANKLLSNQESMLRGSKIISEILSKIPDNLNEIDRYKLVAKEYNGSINEKANQDYTGYLLSTRDGLIMAWTKIMSGEA